MKMRRVLTCALLGGIAMSAHAGLFIPKNSTMLMGMVSPDSRTLEMSYGFTRDWSGSAGWHRYENDKGDVTRDFYALRATYLALRSYQSDGIANVYVYGGPAIAHSNETDDDKPGLQSGFWADYETRRIYTRVSVQNHWTSAYSQTVNTAQVLWAPYAADYEEVAAWMGVQLERRNGLSDATQITPMLRFLQRNWWIDGGVSVNSAHRGDLFFNLMLLY